MPQLGCPNGTISIYPFCILERAVMDIDILLGNIPSNIAQLLQTNFETAVENITTTLEDAQTVLHESLENYQISINTLIEEYGTDIRADITASSEASSLEINNAILVLQETLANIRASLQDQLENRIQTVLENIESAKATISSFTNNLQSIIATGFNTLQTAIAERLNEGMTNLGENLITGLTPLGESIISGLSDIIPSIPNIPEIINPVNILDNVTDFTNDMRDNLKNFLTGHSPITPDEAAISSSSFAVAANTAFGGLSLLTMIIEAASFGQMDFTLGNIYLMPVISSMKNISEQISSAGFEAGIAPLLARYYRRDVRPSILPATDVIDMWFRGISDESNLNINLAEHGYTDEDIQKLKDVSLYYPSINELISMMVREAFIPEHIVEAPIELLPYFAKRGILKDWADKLWTAHFMRMPLDVAYQAFWRLPDFGENEFKTHLLLADIHPNDWQTILDVAYQPLTRLESRYAYENEIVDRNYLIQNFQKTGLSLDDANIAADSTIAFILNEERNKLISQLLDQYEDGWLSEEEINENLTTLGLAPERTQFYIAASSVRINRDILNDRLSTYIKALTNGIINKDSFQSICTDLGVQQWRINVELEKYEVLKEYEPTTSS